jgi:hypothetical protein
MASDRRDAVWWVLLLGGGAAAAWFLFDEAASASTVPALPPSPEPEPEGRVIIESVTQTYPSYEDVRNDENALARILRSEVGSGPLVERVAIAWVARNRARARGVSIRRMVCWPTCGPGGVHGEARRPFSSRLSARESDLQVAREVLAAPQSADPTDGAIAAFEPALQDQLYREKRPGYRFDAEGIRKRWAKEGLRLYGKVGRWELFGRGPKRTSSATSTTSGPVTSPSQVESPVSSPSQVP